MRALDGLLTQARLLRIARAQRVQGAIARRARGETGSETDVEAAPVDWIAECGTAHGLLAALVDDSLPADRRRTRLVGVLDMGVLQPFVDEAVGVVLSLIAERRPQDAVFAATWPKVCAHAAPHGAGDPEAVDAGRARRAAVADVARLAVEDVLFEVVRAVIEAGDAARVVAVRPDLPPIVVEPGRVRRAPRPKVEATRAKREAVTSGLSVPVGALALARSATPKPPTRAVLRAEAKRRRQVGEEAARAAVREEGHEAPVQVAPVQVAQVQVAPVQVAQVQVAPVQVAQAGVAQAGVAPVEEVALMDGSAVQVETPTDLGSIESPVPGMPAPAIAASALAAEALATDGAGAAPAAP